jgi:hypothetical protein
MSVNIFKRRCSCLLGSLGLGKKLNDKEKRIQPLSFPNFFPSQIFPIFN